MYWRWRSELRTIKSQGTRQQSSTCSWCLEEMTGIPGWVQTVNGLGYTLRRWDLLKERSQPRLRDKVTLLDLCFRKVTQEQGGGGGCKERDQRWGGWEAGERSVAIGLASIRSAPESSGGYGTPSLIHSLHIYFLSISHATLMYVALNKHSVRPKESSRKCAARLSADSMWKPTPSHSGGVERKLVRNDFADKMWRARSQAKGGIKVWEDRAACAEAWRVRAAYTLWTEMQVCKFTV